MQAEQHKHSFSPSVGCAAQKTGMECLEVLARHDHRLVAKEAIKVGPHNWIQMTLIAIPNCRFCPEDENSEVEIKATVSRFSSALDLPALPMTKYLHAQIGGFGKQRGFHHGVATYCDLNHASPTEIKHQARFNNELTLYHQQSTLHSILSAAGQIGQISA